MEQEVQLLSTFTAWWNDHKISVKSEPQSVYSEYFLGWLEKENLPQTD